MLIWYNKYMKKIVKLKQFLIKPKTPEERKSLEIKVQEGAKKAVREYGEVFKKLAAHDRT